MQNQALITMFKIMYMQNISNDMFWWDDNYIRLWLYNSLVIIFLYMNSRTEWDWSIEEETVTGLVHTLKYDPTELQILKKGWGMRRKYRWKLWDRDDNWYTLKGREITFNGDFDEIVIIYKRLPEMIIDWDANKIIDIPTPLISAIMFLMAYQILPSHYSEWASLSINYYNMAQQIMDQYVSAYGYLNNDDKFTA